MVPGNNGVLFDWSLTERKLVLFIPNFGRKRYLKSCLSSLAQTRVPRDKWLVLVGNDGLDEPMDDLAEEFNLAWFTLPRGNPVVSRNGAFIRNYVIKRCRSEFLFQKDPEVALVPDDPEYDLIERMTDIKPMKIWRNGRPFDLEFSEEYVLGGFPVDERFIPKAIPPPPGLVAAHWGFCIRTEDLRSIRGYDERFTKYGPEDVDLFRRLMRLGFTFRYDPHAYALHVHHSVETDGHGEMCSLGRLIDEETPVRNDPDTWGEGGFRSLL
jgi:GT2 family glycosyltransferase